MSNNKFLNFISEKFNKPSKNLILDWFYRSKNSKNFSQKKISFKVLNNIDIAVRQLSDNIKMMNSFNNKLSTLKNKIKHPNDILKYTDDINNLNDQDKQELSEYLFTLDG